VLAIVTGKHSLRGMSYQLLARMFVNLVCSICVEYICVSLNTILGVAHFPETAVYSWICCILLVSIGGSLVGRQVLRVFGA
jgi:hypothetical protein